VIGSTAYQRIVNGNVFSSIGSKFAEIFAHGKVIRKLSTKTPAAVNAIISTGTTNRATRVHMLGEYVRVGAARRVSNTARAKAISTAQKAVDSIVKRSADKLSVGVDEPGLAALYNTHKACRTIEVLAGQCALRAKKTGGHARAEQDPLRSEVAKFSEDAVGKGTGSRQVVFERSWSIPQGVAWCVDFANENETGFLPHLIPQMDPACGPRRDVGFVSYRIGTRSLHRGLIMLGNGSAYVGGLQVEIVALMRSMLPMVAEPQLYHPAYFALLPQLENVGVTMVGASQRHAMARINAGYAAIEEARSGDPCHVASDVRAMERPENRSLVASMSQWGNAFKVIKPDSQGMRNIIKAASMNLGCLSDETTEEEAKAMVTQSSATLTQQTTGASMTETLARVDALVVESGVAGTQVSDTARAAGPIGNDFVDVLKSRISDKGAAAAEVRGLLGGVQAAMSGVMAAVTGGKRTAQAERIESLLAFTNAFSGDEVAAPLTFLDTFKDMPAEENAFSKLVKATLLDADKGDTTVGDLLFTLEQTAASDMLVNAVWGDATKLSEEVAPAYNDNKQAIGDTLSQKLSSFAYDTDGDFIEGHPLNRDVKALNMLCDAVSTYKKARFTTLRRRDDASVKYAAAMAAMSAMNND
jgi:hypothetical protein